MNEQFINRVIKILMETGTGTEPKREPLKIRTGNPGLSKILPKGPPGSTARNRRDRIAADLKDARADRVEFRKIVGTGPVN